MLSKATYLIPTSASDASSEATQAKPTPLNETAGSSIPEISDSYSQAGVDCGDRSGSPRSGVCPDVGLWASYSPKAKIQEPVDFDELRFTEASKVIHGGTEVVSGVMDVTENLAESLAGLSHGLGAGGALLGTFGSMYEIVHTLEQKSGLIEMSVKEQVLQDAVRNLETELVLEESDLFEAIADLPVPLRQELTHYYGLRISQVEIDRRGFGVVGGYDDDMDKLVDDVVASLEISEDIDTSKERLEEFAKTVNEPTALFELLESADSNANLYNELLEASELLSAARARRDASRSRLGNDVNAAVAVAAGYTARLTSAGLNVARLASVAGPLAVAGQAVVAIGEGYQALNAQQKLSVIEERLHSLTGLENSSSRTLGEFASSEKAALVLECDTVLSRRNSSSVASVGSVSMVTGGALTITGVGLPVGLGLVIGGAAIAAGASLTHLAVGWNNGKKREQIKFPGLVELRAAIAVPKFLEEFAAYFGLPPKILSELLNGAEEN